MGIVVSGLSLCVAWLQSREDVALVGGQLETQWQLNEINADIQNYRGKYGKSPSSLAELLTISKHDSSWHGENGEPSDGWGRPFVFSFDGTNCLVTSYGRDGKPSGIGLDCDLTNVNPKPPQSLLTFDQFIKLRLATGIIRSCVFCGGLAFFLTVLTVKTPDLRGSGLVRLGLKIGATIIGALIAASFMAILEIPRH